ncbi:MAG TPA: MarR family transcriptional regulator [Candidatus Limosilactobacillus intestinigallinarum]|nr:MarR family transcriptional regulator [Candidatus Limosilactobacillus intestinigallinarum]
MQTVFNLDSCIMCITNRSSKLFGDTLDRELRKIGLNRNIWLSLYFIDQNGQITQNELANLVDIKGPSMVKIIRRLDDDRLVQTRQDDNDHRQKIIQLTKDGEDKLMKSLPTVTHFQGLMTKGIPQADLNTVARVMDQMVKNAEQNFD